MKWFGTNWGADVCDPKEHVEAPIGEMCAYCEEDIAKGQNGILLERVRVTRVDQALKLESQHTIPMHIECMIRSTVGSVGHQKGTCPCKGGTDEDPPEMTTREAAIAAYKLYMETSDEADRVAHKVTNKATRIMGRKTHRHRWGQERHEVN